MEKINITEKLEEFYRHLSAADVDRTIFSAKFGDGKTEFLHQFKEKYSDEYTFYTLYPVNYQIAPNEQIMEYIKRDLLFQLILNGTLTPSIEIPDSILLQWYVNEKSFDIVKDIIKFAPSIIGSGSQLSFVLKGAIALAKGISNQCKKFKKFKTKITKGDFEKAVNIIGNLSEGAGNIYELDPISWLIAQSIAKQDKKSVLIIEDLDRIDPAHLFRILNIFSAHIDRKYLCSDETIYKDGEEKKLDELSNKFGFDKIIFVMDAESTEAVFKNFYGDSNYEGYISKFISKRVFHYSITASAQNLLYSHISKECKIKEDTFTKGIESIGVSIEKKSVRDILKTLDRFKDGYRTEKVRVTDDFCFLSNTPLVKLLTILLRLGVKRNQLKGFFYIIKTEYQRIQTENEFIELLGCFIINENLLAQSGQVYYNRNLYQIEFNKNQDGYRTFNCMRPINEMGYPKEDHSLEINIDEILKRALKYVN